MNLTNVITEALAVKDRNFARTATNKILGEDISVGKDVAVIDDVISGYSGARGKVRSVSDSNPGFARVQLENGTEVEMQTSLLIPV